MVKKEQFTLQKYQYTGWHNDTGKRGDIVYVDVKYKHPDPSKKLIWGFDSNGDRVSGDYVGFFEKVGKPQTFEFDQTGNYAMGEKKVRQAAIVRAIKKGW